MQETNVRNSAYCAAVEHGCRQVAAARGEKSERLYAVGLELEQLLGGHINCATVQHGKYLVRCLRPRVEMIGECEIYILLLPKKSRAELMGERKINSH